MVAWVRVSLPVFLLRSLGSWPNGCGAAAAFGCLSGLSDVVAGGGRWRCLRLISSVVARVLIDLYWLGLSHYLGF